MKRQLPNCLTCVKRYPAFPPVFFNNKPFNMVVKLPSKIVFKHRVIPKMVGGSVFTPKINLKGVRLIFAVFGVFHKSLYTSGIIKLGGIFRKPQSVMVYRPLVFKIGNFPFREIHQ